MLANLFEKFRNRGLENYGFCPCHYFSAPALSWDAMLSMSKVKLDVTSDDVMYLLSEKLMSGNNSYIFKTYSKANNKYLIFYDPK